MQSLTLRSLFSDLETELYHLEDCPVECEGMTQLISLFLEAKGIAHRKMIGCAQPIDDNIAVFPHCWIELEDGRTIDFRLRMWMGDKPEVPHGVFFPERSGIEYIGGVYDQPTISLELAKMLSDDKILDLL